MKEEEDEEGEEEKNKKKKRKRRRKKIDEKISYKGEPSRQRTSASFVT